MSYIRINSISIKNYRSFGDEQYFEFPDAAYKKPVAIVGYNNSGKTNLINCILYGIGEKYVSEGTFEKTDLHDIDYSNNIEINVNLTGSSYPCQEYYDKISRSNKTEKSITGEYKITTKVDGEIISSELKPSLFGMNKQYRIFYINFHNIKEEISTQKTSWGNLKSFLAKHIKKIVEEDDVLTNRKSDFVHAIETASMNVLNGDPEHGGDEKSKLSKFIDRIKENYNMNLRDNNVEVDFKLPEYEDIFLHMMFKVGLNGSKSNMVPIEHFGDGYISMFVMAVILAIAEEETDEKCLFLFEEPESFLHENHQEYFYKTVLCSLSERGHQVIYTTHSDRMIDIFDTNGLIRLEMEDNRTVKKYNDTGDFEPNIPANEDNVVSFQNYNDFIRTIEPNLNRILFSKKVILVEGPNDVMVYKNAIQKKVENEIIDRDDISDKKKYAETYLNFKNYAVIPHHGKSTAVYLAKLCSHFGLEYFMINDWDLTESELDIDMISNIATIDELKNSIFYKKADSTKKGTITINWKLIVASENENIHFNIPKLEKIVGYTAQDKDSVKIFGIISNEAFIVTDSLFPEKLINFLEIDKINSTSENVQNVVTVEELSSDDDIPF
ncbi:AAA family ATPase [Candidatus Dojkabacteria bacterium]|nr:AAA family ATPase [Candidatus Dojkabacteria bacterium]